MLAFDMNRPKRPFVSVELALVGIKWDIRYDPFFAFMKVISHTTRRVPYNRLTFYPNRKVQNLVFSIVKSKHNKCLMRTFTGFRPCFVD